MSARSRQQQTLQSARSAHFTAEKEHREQEIEKLEDEMDNQKTKLGEQIMIKKVNELAEIQMGGAL